MEFARGRSKHRESLLPNGPPLVFKFVLAGKCTGQLNRVNQKYVGGMHFLPVYYSTTAQVGLNAHIKIWFRPYICHQLKMYIIATFTIPVSLEIYISKTKTYLDVVLELFKLRVPHPCSLPWPVHSTPQQLQEFSSLGSGEGGFPVYL